MQISHYYPASRTGWATASVCAHPPNLPLIDGSGLPPGSAQFIAARHTTGAGWLVKLTVAW